MTNSGSNGNRTILDIWIARFGSAFAWFWMVLWAMMGIVGMSDLISANAPETVDKVMPFVCIGMAALNFLLIIKCRKTKALVRDFRLYCAVLAKQPEHSIDKMAQVLNIPVETAAANVQEMCRRGYFNGYLDHQARRIVFHHQQPQVNVVYCPGCGARNSVSGNGGSCRYCDSPLQP
ncbi:MAG: hypothetical protein Q4G00_03170 [Clostridia bacterium]|nr:hypothetical protein [Clostridia bacterium]